MRRRARSRGAADGPRPAKNRNGALAGARLCILAAALASPAGAQDLSRYEAGPGNSAEALYSVENTLPLVTECLETRGRPGEDRRACLGLTMDLCIRFRANETTVGSIRCAAGEAEAWAVIVGDRTVRIRSKADDELKAALEVSQARWLAHREATCGLWDEVFRGGSLARQIGADCVREMTARRALDLMAIDEALGQ